MCWFARAERALGRGGVLGRYHRCCRPCALRLGHNTPSPPAVLRKTLGGVVGWRRQGRRRRQHTHTRAGRHTPAPAPAPPRPSAPARQRLFVTVIHTSIRPALVARGLCAPHLESPRAHVSRCAPRAPLVPRLPTPTRAPRGPAPGAILCGVPACMEFAGFAPQALSSDFDWRPRPRRPRRQWRARSRARVTHT